MLQLVSKMPQSVNDIVIDFNLTTEQDLDSLVLPLLLLLGWSTSIFKENCVSFMSSTLDYVALLIRLT